MGLKPRKTNEPKTKPTAASVSTFIAKVDDHQRRAECKTLSEMMQRVSGERPRMWGSSIIGFGTYHYKYASGREGDWMRTGFSPRRAAMTVYCMPGFKKMGKHLAKLGPHKHSVSCLYIRRLEDIDLVVLEKLIADSLVEMERIYGP
jgi:hypothetical protein